MWYMKKQGYKCTTIETYVYSLKRLNANLEDPENVKEALATLECSATQKNITVAAYTLYLHTQGKTWQAPRCKVTRKLPFIPTEQELDSLIAGCGKKTSTFLQLLMETALRLSEACNLEWKDIDLQRRIIVFNKPLKNGKPRIFNISSKLQNMISKLPRNNEYLFETNKKVTRQTVFCKARKRLANKLDNPRLLRISFHTFRHWKATMEYHKTKDILRVKELLGHRNLDTSLLYIQLEKALFQNESDEFIVKAAKESEQVKALLEVGFEYVCEKDDLMFFRKRK